MMFGANLGAIPPTSYLPSFKKIPLESFESLNASIHYLRSIYNPEVRGSRRRRKSSQLNVHPKLTTADVPAFASLNHVRTDPFERVYAIKWLTALISALDPAEDDEFASDAQAREITIHNAASLLAVCAGTSAAGTVLRDFLFTYHPPQTSLSESSGPIPIVVTITDIPLDNDDFGSMGAQTWGGACVLSEMLVEDPRSFGISADQLNTQGQAVFRVLELGAGTGLVSLIVARLLRQIGVAASCQVEIIATDYYPSVLANLRSNIQTNIHTDTESPVTVLTHSLDWSSFGSEDTKLPPFDQPFDLVLGADIVYEPKHAEWIHSCLTHLLRRPSDLPKSGPDTHSAFFHLVLPLRTTHLLESSTVEPIFSGKSSAGNPSLRIMTKDTLVCDTETGEEVEYAYYKIGWI
ncbi:hypothetical protein D9756_010696 [Leucocoprinus leucothites]|uniref:Uncharacterized protein n=1 Tax=Leucocoprinus leucothites TaxID=201217 RepID=A0A8H5CT60_9AGAR|nr:hypothetical protein D9756_010696 [Leucoagaricus leucothites]